MVVAAAVVVVVGLAVLLGFGGFVVFCGLPGPWVSTSLTLVATEMTTLSVALGGAVKGCRTGISK